MAAQPSKSGHPAITRTRVFLAWDSKHKREQRPEATTRHPPCSPGESRRGGAWSYNRSRCDFTLSHELCSKPVQVYAKPRDEARSPEAMLDPPMASCSSRAGTLASATVTITIE
ncbi:unnamed protein product [Rangifer tarandus platyrhynchus]